MYLKDPKNGLPSVTLTAFALGFAVALTKLLISGMQIGTYQMSPFSGVDFAAVVSSLGGLYWARRKDVSVEKPNED